MRRVAVACGVLAAVLVTAAPAFAAPGPSDAPEYWFDQWQVESLWAQGAQGQGVTIAEIDTGVNATLPELAGQILPGHDFGIPGNGQVDREVSEFGHGTAMASIMVGRRGILGITGLAPGAKVLPIAVPLTGTTDSGLSDDLAPAIKWAVDHGGKVISMSLGGDRTPATGADPCPADEQAAVYYALRKGAIVLAAGGNDGPDVNTVEEPGVCLGVVSVGAVDSSDAVAPFSSRHPYLTLTAPGVGIASLSRVPGSAYSGDGTSQATALASAVFALVWSKYPAASGSEIVARVLATLDRRRATRDPAYGYGVINAFRAVTASVPRSAPNPVFAAAAPFMARADAFAEAAALPKPPPAGSGAVTVGSVRIGSSPRLHDPLVRYGLVTSGTGLLVLVLLAIVAWVARRRRADLELARLRASVQAAHAVDQAIFWREISSPPHTPDPPTWWTGPGQP